MENTNELKGWDGYSRVGQAVYDRHFYFEISISEALDIVQNPDPELYSEEEINNARALFAHYSK